MKANAPLFGAVAACILLTPAAAADRYQLDPAHTHVVFSVERFGFNDVIANFADVNGTVVLDQASPENSSVEAEINVASLESFDATRNEHLRGAFWFNMEEHDAILFRSTSVSLTSETTAIVEGELTLLGVTKPVTLDVTLNKLGTDPATRREAAGFSATATLNRSDWGMETAANLIGDEVSIRIETLAMKED